MATLTKQIILCAALAALVPGFSGCRCTKTDETRPATVTDNDVYPYEGGKIDPYVKLIIPPAGGPSPSDGTLTIPIGSFSPGDNGQACFPGSQGWNKYYVTFYFLGPNVSPPPNPNNYPNPENRNSVTVETALTENGTSLDTGIVIMNNLNPTDKVCNDDATLVFTPNPKLSRVTFTPTGSGKKYRVTIFYKSATAGGLSEIKMHWSYP